MRRLVYNNALAPTQVVTQPGPSSLSNMMVVKFIIAMVAITLVISVILFFCYRRYRRQRRDKIDASFRREAIANPKEFRKVDGNVKGLIVDENGRDVLYINSLEERKEQDFPNFMSNPSYEEEKEKRMDFTVERSRKSPIVKDLVLPSSPTKEVLTPPPPPPPPPVKKSITPPAPSTVKKDSKPPPPLPKSGCLVSSSRPPPAPRVKTNNQNKAGASTEERSTGNGMAHAKLKPLHWDKVTINVDHSMVWDEINDGSLRFDDGLIESLFGYSASKHQTLQRNVVSPSSSTSSPSVAAQIFILDPRKSQNIAIVLKSLTISRKEIVDALLDGHGLTADVLEKLARVSPTKDEETKILQFNGNPTKLADAESFLYHILKAVPTAFVRVNAMLFRANYDTEILHLKESLQTLELSCKELRTRGLFLKLLEAILKAGNRMNAGTSRGNAQGFNLTALRKLSDVKSNDGKTTLLHFVVEQVVRAEGRRCVLNRNQSHDKSDNHNTAEERKKECLLLGLPVIRELSNEFSNVKNTATIEYNSFINTCSSLTARVAEIRTLIASFSGSDQGGFVKEMKGLLEQCEEELKVVREEQTRVMELVKRTTEYYQAGALKKEGACSLQLFVIVKDFLAMVDRVCVDIHQNLQKKENVTANAGPTRALTPVRYPDFRLNWVSDMSRTNPSSESDDDF